MTERKGGDDKFGLSQTIVIYVHSTHRMKTMKTVIE